MLYFVSSLSPKVWLQFLKLESNGANYFNSKGFVSMEKRYFKYRNRVYIARNTRSHTTRCELWSISVAGEEDMLLGVFQDGLFQRIDDYYKLPWDVYKGAERLVMLVGLTWKQYLVDYKELRSVEWLRMNTRKGPLPHIDKIKRVKKLRRAGVTFRDIEWVIFKTINKNLKTLYRWNKYELSTVEGLHK